MTGTGQHFDTLTVHVRRRGSATDSVTYTLNTAFIVSMTMNGAASEDGVQETLALAVGSVSAQVPA
jgi:type VI protein secretion system component Hcp